MIELFYNGPEHAYDDLTLACERVERLTDMAHEILRQLVENEDRVENVHGVCYGLCLTMVAVQQQLGDIKVHAGILSRQASVKDVKARKGGAR